MVPRSSERFNSARSSLTKMHDERLCLISKMVLPHGDLEEND